jgi:hypothetical protein
VGRKGGKAGDYDDWTVERLRKRAADVGVSGRSGMNKAELPATRSASDGDGVDRAVAVGDVRLL